MQESGVNSQDAKVCGGEQLWPHSQYMCVSIHCPYQKICDDWQALRIVMMVYIRLWVSYCFMIH